MHFLKIRIIIAKKTKKNIKAYSFTVKIRGAVQNTEMSVKGGGGGAKPLSSFCCAYLYMKKKELHFCSYVRWTLEGGGAMTLADMSAKTVIFFDGPQTSHCTV